MIASPHLVPWLAATLLIHGCSNSHSAPPAPELPKAPYEVVAPDHLRVREDLVTELAFARARVSDVQTTLQGFGRVAFAPNASYAVRVPVVAFVERVDAAVGSEVKPGQVLATLRSSEVARLRADARRLGVTIAMERDAVERLSRLVPEGAASSRDLVEAKARLETAEADVRGIQESLTAVGLGGGGAERFELRASAAGQVLLRSINPGERVAPDDTGPAFMVGDGSKLVVRGAFPERDAPLLKENAPCSFVIPALGADRFEGTVVQAVRAVDARTRTAEAACMPRAVEPRLRAEMVARVEVSVRGEGILVVPRSALLLRRDDHIVFVRIEPSVLERRRVEVGTNLGEQVQILRGLKEGEEVVIKNAVLLDGELDLVL